MASHRRFAHELLAKTAKDFAACWYEEAAHDNEFYAFYPSQKMFINKEWKRFVEQARIQLTLMLGRDDVAEVLKEQIFEALVKHASLPGNMDKRVAAQAIMTGDVPNLTPTVH